MEECSCCFLKDLLCSWKMLSLSFASSEGKNTSFSMSIINGIFLIEEWKCVFTFIENERQEIMHVIVLGAPQSWMMS